MNRFHRVSGKVCSRARFIGKSQRARLHDSVSSLANDSDLIRHPDPDKFSDRSILP